MAKAKPGGADMVGQIAMAGCALALLVLFFTGWRDEEAAVLFVVALLFLTVGAVTR